ncbi:MAG: asparagine synthase, partial [Elusimicrobia bacterium]|nr:asparagine synthase [Elusimicrobiota bacterium]
MYETDAVLFSGGLDSSVLLYLKRTPAVNVRFEDFGGDSGYCDIIEKDLGAEIHRRVVTRDEALDAVRKVIKILRSFDPAIPNDLAVYFGLEKAGELGYNSLMTGDGSDELFGGYSYMQDMEDL